MKVHAKVEAYLAQLEKSLGEIPISDKAEIVMEIKSHILSAIENDPGANVDTILSSLGAPEQVANRYLLERGLRPVKPPRTPVLKWLVIGFLGTGVLVLGFVAIVFSQLTPLMEVNEETGQVKFLGGMIDIDEMDGTFHIGSTILRDGLQMSKHSGQKKVDSAEELRIDFNNGKFDLRTAENDVLKWECKTQNMQGREFLIDEGAQIHFDFQQSAATKCDVTIPAKLKVQISGPNGKVSLRRPAFPVEAKITNGKVSIRPDRAKKYRYDLSVVNGVVDDFDSSPDGDAIALKISLVNGKIDRRGPRRDSHDEDDD